MEVEGTPKELAWQDFYGALSEGFLPLDDELRTLFDQTLHFEVGDPHATGGGLPRTYDMSNEDGGPNWLLLFQYLLQHCRHIQHYDTVYILVDTRDLTKVDTVEPTLANWPAVAAWWSSRLHYVGPGDEQVDLVFVRACSDTGLNLVHPTWAGTFVLAALVFLFPKTHFILLDSDCVPVTLFEVDELWALTSEPLLQCQTPAQGSNPDGPAPKARKTQQEEGMHDAEQRVILVTEPHTDTNAGFVVVLDSGHEAPLDIESMDEQASQATGSALGKFWLDLAAEAFAKYRALTLEYLCNYSNILPFFPSRSRVKSSTVDWRIAWAHTRYTVDWAL